MTNSFRLTDSPLLPPCLLRSALWRLFASLLFAGLWSLSSPLMRAQRTCDQGCSGNPDFNTFLGNDAFQSNTTGGENTGHWRIGAL